MDAPQKVLLFSYKFPPVKSIGATRNYNVAFQFQRFFQEVTVCTTSNDKLFPQEEFPPIEGLVKYRVPTLDYKTVSYRIFNRAYSGSFSRGRFRRFIQRVKDSFPFNFFLDEGSLWYIWKAYQLGTKLINEEEITHLYSSFRPMADHWIAYMLKRRFPDLCWIADFRDPHVDETRHNVILPGWQHRINRRLFQRADIITTVSDGLATYLERYGKPVLTLRNGIHHFIKPLPHTFPTKGKFTITYTGSLYAGYQSAEPLFRTLEKALKEQLISADNLLLLYVGPSKPIWEWWVKKYHLEKITKAYPVHPISQILCLQQQSHINLLLSWSGEKTKGILTGKIYEYLEAKRPILALINGPSDDEIKAIVEGTSSGAVFDQEAKSIEIQAFLMQHYQAWEQGKFKHQPDLSKLQFFQWEQTFPKFLARAGITS